MFPRSFNIHTKTDGAENKEGGWDGTGWDGGGEGVVLHQQLTCSTQLNADVKRPREGGGRPIPSLYSCAELRDCAALEPSDLVCEVRGRFPCGPPLPGLPRGFPLTWFTLIRGLFLRSPFRFDINLRLRLNFAVVVEENVKCVNPFAVRGTHTTSGGN